MISHTSQGPAVYQASWIDKITLFLQLSQIFSGVYDISTTVYCYKLAADSQTEVSKRKYKYIWHIFLSFYIYKFSLSKIVNLLHKIAFFPRKTATLTKSSQDQEYFLMSVENVLHLLQCTCSDTNALANA